MFNRFEALKKCIEDKSMESDTLTLMIDFYSMKGVFTDAEVSELMALINPVVAEQVVVE